MITKHKVTELFAINLTCDKCGTITEYKGLSGDMANPYQYVCPNCGEVTNMDNTYPHLAWIHEEKGEPVEFEDVNKEESDRYVDEILDEMWDKQLEGVYD